MSEPLALAAPGLVLMAAIIAISGFFSGSETALFFLTRDDEREMAAGQGGERVAASLLANPDRLLTAILFWNLVANLTYFAVGIAVTRWLIDAGYTAAAGALNLGALVAIIVLGEVLPKSVALFRRRQLARLVARPLAIAVRIVDPFRPVLSRVAAILRRGLYGRLQPDDQLDSLALDRAVRAGQSEEAERASVEAFKRTLALLSDTVEDLMRPRKAFDALPTSGDTEITLVGDVLLRSDRHGHLVAPAYCMSADRQVADDAWQRLPYLPWSAPAASAFDVLHVRRERHDPATNSEVRDEAGLTKDRVAAVGIVGEYGDLLGLLTPDDLADSLISGKASRLRRAFRREPIAADRSGRLLVDGMTSLRVLGQRLQVSSEEVRESVGETRTVAGLVQAALGRPADVGDVVIWGRHRLTVLDNDRPGEFRIAVEEAGEGSTTGDKSP